MAIDQQATADMPRNVIEGWLASLFVPEYRLASLSFAPMVGVFAATLSVSNPQPANAGTGAQPPRLFFKLWYNLRLLLVKNGGKT